MNKYYIIVFLVVTLAACKGDKVSLIKKIDTPFHRPEPRWGKIKFGSDEKFSVIAKDVKGYLQIRSSDNSLLFSGKNLIVKDVFKDRNFLILNVSEIRKRGKSFHSLVLFVAHDNQIFSRIVSDSQGLRMTEDGQIFFISKITDFSYPKVEIVVGAHFEGEIGGYWKAELDLKS